SGSARVSSPTGRSPCRGSSPTASSWTRPRPPTASSTGRPPARASSCSRWRPPATGLAGPAGGRLAPGECEKEHAMTDRPDLVIDGDGHVIEGNETYQRIDPRHRGRRPVYTEASRGNIVRLVDGKVGGPDPECGFVRVNGNLPPPLGKAIHYRRMGTYNPWARLADMDRDQIDVA